MSGNRGLNGNQNHSCKSISTKVLQPPGGSSSISFGDGSAYHSSAKSGGGRNASKPPMQRRQEPPSSYGQGYEQAQPSHNAPRRPRSNSDDVGADALDSAMSSKRGGVPGLESHYSSSGKGNAPSSYDNEPSYSGNSARGSQAKMSSQEYAAALRAQISAKRMLGGDDNGSNYGSNSNSGRDSGRGRNGSYSNDNSYGSDNYGGNSGGNSYNPMDSIGNSNANNGYGRGQQGKMSSGDYAAALKAQIASRPMRGDEVTTNVGAREGGQRNRGGNNNGNGIGYGGNGNSGRNGGGYDGDYKENSFPGMGGGASAPSGGYKCSNPPGGRSSFQLC